MTLNQGSEPGKCYAKIEHGNKLLNPGAIEK